MSIRDNVFYRFEPRSVRMVVPSDVVGVYQLAHYVNGKLNIGYVGRSDTSLQERLATHNLLYRFDYFWFHVERNVYEAFLAEARIWHELKDGQPLINKFHPAIPSGWSLRCPYCVALTQIRQFLQTKKSA